MMLRKYLSVLLIFVSLNVFAFRPPDVWQALRRSFQFKDLSKQPEVNAQIQFLKAHPAYFRAFAKNSKPYIFFILEYIKSQRLPGELALLPMIESNYNPFAYSRAGAAGLWQLMPGTGSGLGVKQDWWYDGRRGIINSTRAATDYLQYLNRFFGGNWILSVAAYDSGEGTVQRAIKQNIQAHKDTSFWSLPLPRETQAYLPRLLAMASIIKYPKYFGINLPYEPYEPHFQEIEVGSQIDLTHAAKLAHMKYGDLLKLNPGHNRWATAPNQPQTLLLPLDRVTLFQANLTQVPENERITWARHEVLSGENLGLIAIKEKSSVHLIKEINHLKSDTIKIGQKLLIPASKKISPHNLTETKKRLAINQNQNIGPHSLIHIVQKNDSFKLLERKYRVKENQIRYWNQIKAQQNLNEGDKLIIWQKKTSPLVYVVRTGDSLSRIAHRFHISQKNLSRWNANVAKKTYLKVGQKLVVYGKS